MKWIKKIIKKPMVQYGTVLVLIVTVVTVGIVHILNEDRTGENPTKEERLQKEIEQLEKHK